MAQVKRATFQVLPMRSKTPATLDILLNLKAIPRPDVEEAIIGNIKAELYDLIITYNISLPTTLTERQKEHVTKMRDNA